MKHPWVVVLDRGKDKINIGRYLTEFLAEDRAKLLNDLMRSTYYEGYKKGVGDGTKPNDPIRIT